MKFASKIAIALSACALAVSAVTPAAAQNKSKKEKNAKAVEAPKRNYSPEFRKAFAPALDLFSKNKDAAGAKAAFPSVVAAIKNDDDRYEAGVFAINVGAQLKDMKFQQEGIDLLLASATTPANLKTQYLFQKGAIAFDAKDFAGAEKHMIDAYNAGHRGNNVEYLISTAQSQLNKNTEAMTWLTKAIDAGRAAGKVDKTYLIRAANIAAKAKDYKGAAGWYKQLAQTERSADYWHDALVFFDRSLTLDPEETLDLMRLMRATDALRFQQEYAQYLDSLSYIGVRYPAEAVAVLDEGFAKGIISRSNVTFGERYNEAKGRLAEDTRTLPSALTPATAANAKGILTSLTGDSFYSHKNYKTAKDLYEAALQKGAVLDKDGKNQTDRTRFRLAMSKAMLGDYAGAKADFALVTGANRKAIAEYWVMYVDQKANPAPAAPAAPAVTPVTS